LNLNYVCWIYIYIYIYMNSTTPKRHAETLRNRNIPFQLKKQKHLPKRNWQPWAKQASSFPPNCLIPKQLKKLWSLIFLFYISGPYFQIFFILIFLIVFVFWYFFLKSNVNIDSIKLINNFEISTLKLNATKVNF